jgi:hypothetical protein
MYRDFVDFVVFVQQMPMHVNNCLFLIALLHVAIFTHDVGT